jgi:hypothetical protein
MYKSRRLYPSCDYPSIVDGSIQRKIKKSGIEEPIVTYIYKDGNLDRMGSENPSAGTVGILIGIVGYQDAGMHSNHAISAVKHDRTLFCFNAWGEDAKPLDDKIFQELKEIYNCNKIFKYNGPNLQQDASCVGYASKFIVDVINNLKTYNLENHSTFSDFVHGTMTMVSEENMMRLLRDRGGRENLGEPVSRNIPVNLRHKKPVKTKTNEVMRIPNENLDIEMVDREIANALAAQGFHTWVNHRLSPGGPGINFKTRNNAYNNYLTFAKSSQPFTLSRNEFNKEVDKYKQ